MALHLEVKESRWIQQLPSLSSENEAEPAVTLTCVNSLMAGQVALVAEGSLAAVTLVWLVAVDLGHVLFERIFIWELWVAPVADVTVVFCKKK